MVRECSLHQVGERDSDRVLRVRVVCEGDEVVFEFSHVSSGLIYACRRCKQKSNLFVEHDTLNN